MGSFFQDLRYALRTLGRAPGFTSIAVLTLALGIGANTAIFSLVHAVILKPLPFRDPQRLIAVWDTYLPQYPQLGVSPPELAAWQQQTDLFEETAWYRYVPQNFSLTAPGAEALEVHAAFVSPALFPMLGVTPASGRGFAAREDAHAALLSRALWLRRFGGDPAIAGKSIRLNDQEFTVAGVMPAGFRFPEWADLWLPPGPLQGDEMSNPVRHALGFLGRLRSGTTLTQADARLRTIAARLAAEHPKTSTGFGMKVAALQDDLTASQRPALMLLLGAVTLVLLIACGNIANLLLSRASGRAKEVAVRTALGAGSWRMVRQLLTESLVLASLGGALGFALAAWSLATFAPEPVPLDSTVLLFLLAVSTATGLVSGLAPALQTLGSDMNSVIKSAAPAGGGSSAVRGTLVVLEFALALMLVVGAGILVKSFLRLMQVDPGFNPRGVLTLRLSIPPSRQAALLFHAIEQRVRTLPGVESISTANTLPLIANRAIVQRFNVPGSPLINPDALPAAQQRSVSPDYFRALGIPLRAGRDFTERDLKDQVVIVNETMARRFWPGENPVGRQFVTGPWGPNPTSSTIIGVVGDVKDFGLDSEQTMDLYFPSLLPQYLVVRTGGDAATLAAAVRREVQAVDAELPISDVSTMEEIVTKSASSRRWTMALLAVFAGLALILALVGVYGVMSWSVAQRTREIGVRMALGAGRGQVMGMMLRYGLKLSVAGLTIGMAGAMALRRVLAGLVFGVSPADPVIYCGVAVSMLAVALLACYLPARRASRVDPLIALRWE
ncbi:MAG TPA: ABC transporter permease [Bryobacteraceae bacterium]|jgi:putative ABC transport system permease protein